MKSVLKARLIYIVFSAVLMMQPGVSAFCQQTTAVDSSAIKDSIELASNDTLPSSAYELKVPSHTATFYSLHMQGILFTVLILLMAYVSYRYWSDNRAKRDVSDSTN